MDVIIKIGLYCPRSFGEWIFFTSLNINPFPRSVFYLKHIDLFLPVCFLPLNHNLWAISWQQNQSGTYSWETHSQLANISLVSLYKKHTGHKIASEIYVITFPCPLSLHWLAFSLFLTALWLQVVSVSHFISYTYRQSGCFLISSWEGRWLDLSNWCSQVS